MDFPGHHSKRRRLLLPSTIRRGLRVETPVAVLRGLAGCPAGVWAGDSRIVKLCTELNFRVAAYSVDIERAHAGLDFENMLLLEPCAEWTHNIVSWSRGMRVGLHFDLLDLCPKSHLAW